VLGQAPCARMAGRSRAATCEGGPAVRPQPIAFLVHPDGRDARASRVRALRSCPCQARPSADQRGSEVPWRVHLQPHKGAAAWGTVSPGGDELSRRFRGALDSGEESVVRRKRESRRPAGLLAVARPKTIRRCLRAVRRPKSGSQSSAVASGARLARTRVASEGGDIGESEVPGGAGP
jgi:hypothetical protein